MNAKDYPKHCVGCQDESKCRQKYFMNADTEPVEGFVGASDFWCDDHKPVYTHSESAGHYPETDSPMHCAECGRPLQCSLTDDGVDYVKEHTQEVKGAGCCRELWPVLFADYLS